MCLVLWGDKQSITTEVAGRAWGSDINMLRVSAKTHWIRSIGQHRLNARLEMGAIASSEFDDVPASLRFFTGGDQSIRGFSYQTISPLDEDNDLIGAQYQLASSLEYSYPISDSWRAAAFVDIGTATNDFDESLSKGIGVGTRWMSPVGPVRIYLARGINDQTRQWRLHFSMGPDL